MPQKSTYEDLEKRVKELEAENRALSSRRAELQTKCGELFYETIFDKITSAITVRDSKELRIVKINKAGENLLGYSRKELIGKNFYDFYPKEEADFFTGKDREVLNNGEVVDIPLESMQTPFRGEKILHTTKIPMINENGDAEYLITISEDKTQRLKSEMPLLESEENFRSIFNNADIGIMVTDLTGEHFYLANDAQCQMLGYEREQLLALGIKDLHPEEELQMVAANFQKHLRREDHLAVNIPLIRSDGSIFYADIYSSPLTLEGRLCILGLFVDVNSRRKNEEELTYRAELEALVSDISSSFLNVPSEMMDDAINASLQQLGEFAGVDRCYVFLFDDDGLKMDNTHEWCRKGIEPQVDNLKGLPTNMFPWWMGKLNRGEHIHIPKVDNLPKEADAEKQILQPQGIQSLVVVPMEYKDKLVGFVGFDSVNTEKSWIAEDILLIKTVGNVFLNAMQRRQHEEVLKREREQLLAIFDGSDEIIYVADPMTYEILYVNQITKKLFGDIIGQKCYHALQNLESPCPFCTNIHIFGENIGKTHIWEFQNKFNKRWYRCTDRAIHWPDGRMVRYEMAVDFTDRKRAEQELRESERRFRDLAEMLPEVVFEADRDMNLIYANQQTFSLLGYTKQDFEDGLNCLDLIILEDRKRAQEFAAKLFNGEELGAVEYQGLKKDGSTFPILTHGRPIFNTEGGIEGVRGIVVDLTERKRMGEALREQEEKLARAQKMESLGLLAGGVAHDLNNVLAGIVTYPEILLMNLPEDSTFRKPLETIKTSGFRAAAIVQDLLTVARGVAITKEPINLNQIIENHLKSPEFKKLQQSHPTVKIDADLDSDLLNVNGSRLHIGKVVMNLLSNALEAIEGRGRITIATSNRFVDRPLRGYHTISIGEYVVLSVSDNGPGISPDDLGRIFEPFYTKKIMGRSGTGLGLAVVWNVMQDHEGKIDVICKENGTMFEMYFPSTRETILEKAPSLSLNDYRGNGETILVVDDVESQREISCFMLDTLGYKAVAVSSGEEAVEYLKENTADLLLLDMIMDPGINGRETYERIIKIHPGQKAIIVSGFIESSEVREAQQMGAGRFIRKPIQLESIGLAIKEEFGK